jgi:predicted lipoprotein
MKGALLAAVVAAALPGCKIIKTPTAEEKAAAAAKTAFDPNAKVEAIWQSEAVPYFEKRAGDLKDVTQLSASSPDAAGEKYGNPRKQSSSPWTYAVKITGKVVAADTASRAATLDVDADGDGKADAKVQIGPALRGTALRDTLEFVNFNEFKNQIEWARPRGKIITVPPPVHGRRAGTRGCDHRSLSGTERRSEPSASTGCAISVPPERNPTTRSGVSSRMRSGFPKR